MSDDDKTKQALIRLKRRIGRERARCERFEAAATTYMGQDRARGEANICWLVIGMLDAEIAKLAKGKP